MDWVVERVCAAEQSRCLSLLRRVELDRRSEPSCNNGNTHPNPDPDAHADTDATHSDTNANACSNGNAHGNGEPHRDAVPPLGGVRATATTR